RHLLNPLRERVQNALLRRQIELSERFLHHEAVKKSTAESDLNRTLRLFLDGPVVAYRFRRKGDQREIIWISENIYQFGYNAARLAGKRWESLVHPDDVEGIAPGRCDFSDGEDFTDCRKEYRLRCQDGEYRWIYDYIVPVFNSEGTISFFDGYFLDVTRSHLTREALLHEKERAQVTLQSIGDAVVTTGADGRVQFLNGGAEALTGWRSKDARGVHLNEVLVIRIDERKGWIRDPLKFFYRQRDTSRRERLVVEYSSRNGDLGLVEFNVSPIDSGGDILGHVLVLREVTEQEELRKEIEFQARHDDLTGIYNRWEFENRFEGMLAGAVDDGARHVLMFLDLDQFKLVNDTCGHHCGDELLRQLTARFGACLDNEAILARLGGDEFGVLLKDCSIERGMKVARALRDSARKFRFVWQGRTFEIGVSIGIVPVAPPYASIHHLMKLADVACYLAKERGGDGIRLHSDGDQELARRRQEMNWATRLKGSMAADDFALHYQDIVPIGESSNTRTRKIEILLRLRDGDGAMLSPEEFLASAERYNLMPELDRWVIRKAFEWYEKTGHAENVVMNINLSGLSFCDGGFLEYIQALFQQYKVPPGAVCFEVTETAAIQNLAEAESFMYSLRGLGCRFALDDFGTGLSSFEYLKVLPVDYVKIDGRFVKGILTDDVDRAMVSAINDVGHTMKLQTVAEYVESEAILGELSKLNVDFAQGYGIGQPRSLDAFSGRILH
ncbi:MAG TPA: EAL domain-containing protein, partial [Gammaproteobacteria bacterium]|nr:EAL domain-containing protein [Gammaproteobacteria bacterium]